MDWKINKTINKDVVVIGGGTAGTIAAVACATLGADTLLVEKNGILGGTMTAVNVNFPGLFYAWGKRIIGGIPWKIVCDAMKDGLDKMPQIPYSPERHWEQQFRINTFSLINTLFKYVKESGATLYLHTILAGVKEEKDCVRVLVCGKEGLIEIKCKALIDASGDANAVALAGYKLNKSETLQPATPMIFLSGYDKINAEKTEIENIYNKALTDGEVPEWLSFNEFYGVLQRKKADIHVICDKDSDNSVGKGLLEVKTYENVEKLIKLIRKIPGCENAKAENYAFECGVRETNRIIGEYEITIDDYKNGTLFEDALCYSFYPIDLHTKGGVEPCYLSDGVIPSVPKRALIPKGSKRIMAVGRCISCDTLANSALRTQVTCMAQGQAAGVVCALASKKNLTVNEVDLKEIKANLQKLGAVVPDKNF